MIDPRDVSRPTKEVYRIGMKYFKSNKEIADYYKIITRTATIWIRNKKTPDGDMIRKLVIDKEVFNQLFNQ